jgi:two-component system nitrogen regulation response regulator NtrX
VRVIAATKRDLQREVGTGKFREDLYFRLAVVPVTVPPLRARRDDIPMLVQHMLKAAGGEGLSVPPETMQSLAAHEWPGNIRELRNVLERSIYMAQATGSTEIGVVTLPTAHTTSDAAFHFEPEKSYRETRAKYDGEFEKRYVKSGSSAGTTATSPPPRAKRRWTANTSTTWRRSTGFVATKRRSDELFSGVSGQARPRWRST